MYFHIYTWYMLGLAHKIIISDTVRTLYTSFGPCFSKCYSSNNICKESLLPLNIFFFVQIYLRFIVFLITLNCFYLAESIPWMVPCFWGRSQLYSFLSSFLSFYTCAMVLICIRPVCLSVHVFVCSIFFPNRKFSSTGWRAACSLVRIVAPCFSMLFCPDHVSKIDLIRVTFVVLKKKALSFQIS